MVGGAGLPGVVSGAEEVRMGKRGEPVETLVSKNVTVTQGSMGALWAQVIEKVGAKRAWRPGMSDQEGWLCLCSVNGKVDMWHDSQGRVFQAATLFMPDFDDDATRGALEGLMRELWGEPLFIVQGPKGYGVARWLHVGDNQYRAEAVLYFAHPTASEAILRAILAAYDIFRAWSAECRRR